VSHKWYICPRIFILSTDFRFSFEVLILKNIAADDADADGDGADDVDVDADYSKQISSYNHVSNFQ
jgi:hypothetical protein